MRELATLALRSPLPMLTDATPHSQAETDQRDRSAIEAALAEALRHEAGRPPRLMEAMTYAVMGPGKRIRPRLVLMAARACGAEIEPALPAACAVEFVHAYSLVHDDLPPMDDDDLRRGRPTVHRKFDEATAILAGDALLALAFETLAAGPEAGAACRELAHAAGPAALVGGQMDDLGGAEAAPDAKDAALNHLERIHRRKTGAMITVSLRLGALAAEAEDDWVAALTTYGDALGLLFQVTDDLLDATGDETAVGKRVAKDSDAGKLTYPGLIGVEPSRRYAAQLAERSIDALQPLGDAAEPLRDLTRQILGRDR